jgi:hypothetical protein
VDEYSDPKSGQYHFLSRKTSTVQKRRLQYEYETTNIDNAAAGESFTLANSEFTFQRPSQVDSKPGNNLIASPAEV